MAEPRTTPCDATERAGRLAKAKQFADAAVTIATVEDENGQFTDAIVTLHVHAGIAAADVICCARLGRHARGENHNEAVELLARVDTSAAKNLAALLGMKTRSAYSSQAASGADRREGQRACNALVKAAEEV